MGLGDRANSGQVIRDRVLSACLEAGVDHPLFEGVNDPPVVPRRRLTRKRRVLPASLQLGTLREGMLAPLRSEGNARSFLDLQGRAAIFLKLEWARWGTPPGLLGTGSLEATGARISGSSFQPKGVHTWCTLF